MKKYVKYAGIAIFFLVILYVGVAVFFNDFRSIYYDIRQNSNVEWNGVRFVRHYGMYYREDNNIIGVHFVGKEWAGGLFIKIEPKFNNKDFVIYSLKTNAEYDLLSADEVLFKGHHAIFAKQRSKDKKLFFMSYIIVENNLIIGIAAKKDSQDMFQKIIDEMEIIN